MKNRKWFYLLLFSILYSLFSIFTGCEKSPMNRLLNPTIDDAIGNTSWGDWIIYDDELKTWGGVMTFTTIEGVVIDFNNSEQPRSGTKCLKFSWNGGDVTAFETSKPQSDYTGFSLIVAKDWTGYTSTTKDLSPGSYAKISFWVRGSLGNNVYLRLEGNNGIYTTPSGTNAWMSNTSDREVTGGWQQYTYALSGSHTTVKDFVRIILRYDEDGNSDTANTRRGTGGTVYIDDIKYIK